MTTETRSLQHRLLAWFRTHQRPLPWRHGYDPYQVWIAEVMGQQTQMGRVVARFHRWLRVFPDIRSLAAAREDEVLKLWEGLGYYRRARDLLACAKRLVAEHHGRLPADRDQLLALPGIGPYTANAIASIAFNQDHPVLDANVRRVFCRLFDVADPPRQATRFLEHQARLLLPGGRAREWNQALMELGALVCTPRRPTCASCPASGLCEARQQGTVADRPVAAGRQRTVAIVMATAVIMANGKVFIQKRLPAGVWPNLWEFPGGRLLAGEEPCEAMEREVMEETGFRLQQIRELATVRHSYTIYRVTLHGFTARLAGSATTPPRLTAAQEYRWVRPADLSRYAFPAGHRQLVERIASGQATPPRN